MCTEGSCAGSRDHFCEESKGVPLPFSLQPSGCRFNALSLKLLQDELQVGCRKGRAIGTRGCLGQGNGGAFERGRVIRDVRQGSVLDD